MPFIRTVHQRLHGCNPHRREYEACQAAELPSNLLLPVGPLEIAPRAVASLRRLAPVLAGHGAAVAHAPGANIRLGVGLADVRTMLAAGPTIGLATDSRLCSDNLNMFEAMRGAAQVDAAGHRAPPADILLRGDIILEILPPGAPAPAGAAVVDAMGRSDEATVIGHGDRSTPALAVLANGAMADALDDDDTHNETHLHPGAHVVPWPSP